MRKSHLIFTIVSASILLGITAYCIYKYTKCEKYKIFKDLGNFPLDATYTRKDYTPDIVSTHKYSGHRYKDHKPYNNLGQPRRYGEF